MIGNGAGVVAAVVRSAGLRQVGAAAAAPIGSGGGRTRGLQE